MQRRINNIFRWEGAIKFSIGERQAGGVFHANFFRFLKIFGSYGVGEILDNA